MMVFFMRFLISALNFRKKHCCISGKSFLWALLLCFFMLNVSAHTLQVEVDRSDQGLSLSLAQPDLMLHPSVVMALEKGLAVTFVHQVEIKRYRWYWKDKKVAYKERWVRVQYQPLAREWRLTFADDKQALSGHALHQSVAHMQAALALVARLSDWNVASLSQINKEKKLIIQHRFALDMEAMGRIFQIGMGNSDWSYEWSSFFEAPRSYGKVRYVIDSATSKVERVQ